MQTMVDSISNVQERHFQSSITELLPGNISIVNGLDLSRPAQWLASLVQGKRGWSGACAVAGAHKSLGAVIEYKFQKREALI